MAFVLTSPEQMLPLNTISCLAGTEETMLVLNTQTSFDGRWNKWNEIHWTCQKRTPEVFAEGEEGEQVSGLIPLSANTVLPKAGKMSVQKRTGCCSRQIRKANIGKSYYQFKRYWQKGWKLEK